VQPAQPQLASRAAYFAEKSDAPEVGDGMSAAASDATIGRQTSRDGWLPPEGEDTGGEPCDKSGCAGVVVQPAQPQLASRLNNRASEHADIRIIVRDLGTLAAHQNHRSLESVRETGATIELTQKSTPESPAVGWCKLLRNVATQPPVVGMAIGIFMKGIRVQVDDLPTCMAMALRDSGSAAGPVTFFVLGLFFKPSLFKKRVYLVKAAKLLSVRYCCAIAVALAIWSLWPSSADELLPVIGGICVLMPVPPVCIVYSTEMGYDSDFAALVVNATLLCSFVFAFSYAAFCGK